MRPFLLLLAAFAASSAACGAFVAARALPKEDRDVLANPEDVSWAPAKREDVVGSFESESVSGEAAGALRRVYYVFSEDGSYTGAALVQEAKNPEFQVLSGTWALEGSSLRVGDAEPAKASASPGRLRLEAPGGTVVLKRSKAG